MPTTPRGRVAYCTAPKIGGTFNFYTLLRRSLEPLGWEVLAPVAGRYTNSLWDSAYADDGCIRIAPDERDLKKVAQALVAWATREQIDIFIPMSVQAAVSAIPHLPPQVRAVMRCSNITRYSYDIVSAHRQYVHRVVATSKRQWDDLHSLRGIPAEKLALIPHGIDFSSYLPAWERRQKPTSLRLGYVGRLLDSAKGVLLFPDVLSRLDRSAVEYTLTIVGDGPDREKMERGLTSWIKRGVVQLVGSQAHERIPDYLAEMDVLLMPSRFEGFGFSLIEAMGAGSLPIVSRIRGVTDWIVEDGKTGFVCNVGRADEIADRVIELDQNREKLSAMSERSHQAAIERFGIDRMGRDYDAVFRAVKEGTPCGTPALSWDAFEISRVFEPLPYRWMPRQIAWPMRRLVDRCMGREVTPM